MTFHDIALCFAVLSLFGGLICLCIAHNARRWESLTEEEQQEEYEWTLW